MTDDMGATKRRPRATRVSGQVAHTVDPGAYNNMFVGAVLAMSWQLAVVVMVPIVAGNWLDGHFGTAPWLTLAGLMVAGLAMTGVVWQTVRQANARVAAMRTKGDKQ